MTTQVIKWRDGTVSTFEIPTWEETQEERAAEGKDTHGWPDPRW